MDPTAFQKQLAREALTKLAERKGLPVASVPAPKQQQPAPKQKTRSKAVSKDRIMGELGSELDALWMRSNPHTTNIPTASMRMPGSNPQSKKQEQGCWIVHNTKTGDLRTDPFPAGERDGCIPSVPQLGKNEVVAAFFHTHPNTKDEGYNRGPSDADLNFATDNNFPGIIRTQIGGYTWFGPAMPQ